MCRRNVFLSRSRLQIGQFVLCLDRCRRSGALSGRGWVEVELIAWDIGASSGGSAIRGAHSAAELFILKSKLAWGMTITLVQCADVGNCGPIRWCSIPLGSVRRNVLGKAGPDKASCSWKVILRCGCSHGRAESRRKTQIQLCP